MKMKSEFLQTIRVAAILIILLTIMPKINLLSQSGILTIDANRNETQSVIEMRTKWWTEAKYSRDNGTGQSGGE